jgi:hypothetical protein
MYLVYLVIFQHLFRCGVAGETVEALPLVMVVSFLAAIIDLRSILSYLAKGKAVQVMDQARAVYWE